MSRREPLEAEEVEKDEKNVKRKDGKNDALSLYSIEKLISDSTTYIGSFYLTAFRNLLIKAKTYSIVVHCDNHWFCLFSTPKTFEIFDPLGFLQKSECLSSTFIQFLKTQLGKKVLYANPQVQSNKSFACGYFVSFFIVNREAGLSFNEIMSKFSKNFQKNERLVKTFFANKL